MKIETTNPNFKLKKQTWTDIRDIRLDGVEALRANQVTSIFTTKYLLHPKTHKPCKMLERKLVDEIIKHLEFALTEITVEELKEFRRNGIPSFVLKKDGKFYYARIPREMNFFSMDIFGEHQCALQKQGCRHLSAASDENGGCAKVRNHATYIERYDWIKSGFETFNTNRDAFLVANCLHYEEFPSHLNNSELIDVE